MKQLKYFTDTVEQLMNKKTTGNSKLYILTNKNRYVNFKPKDFRQMLQAITKEANVNALLNLYKKLGLILTSETDTFTRIQRHKKKTLRVITVDYEKYTVITELLKGEEEKC